MPKYIQYFKNTKPSIQDNIWLIQRDTDVNPDSLGDRHTFVSFDFWKNHQAALQTKLAAQTLGIYFTVTDDILKDSELTQIVLNQAGNIAIDFPIFRDGRGFSTAAILREHFGWQKELRAIGDVLVDQVLPMARVGFDAFDLRQDQNLEFAIEQLNRFSVTMQNDWRGVRTTLQEVLA